MRPSKSETILIPWDPESPEHVERLYQQRIACGWDKGLVEESWRGLQRSGKKTIQWIVFSDSDTAKDSKIAQHLKVWPLEATPISDTAISFGGKSRTPSHATPFIPVGHISLDGEVESNTYQISTFYVSNALQSNGIGRAAMDTVENIAINEPLCAKTLVLKTRSKEKELTSEKWLALGMDPPTFSAQDWYQRRGYEVYETREKMWSQIDSQGRVWWTTAVFMRKDIR